MSEGVKFVSYDGSTEVDIFDLVAGQLYHFAVRAVEYDPVVVNPADLPQTFNGLAVYPETLLVSDIGEEDLVIPALDVDTFPATGIIKIGVELINYLAVNASGNTFVLADITQRGFQNTFARFHRTDGYDGYHYYTPALITYTLGRYEDQNTRVFACQSRFEYPNYQFTVPDGYHQVTKDLLTTDLSGSDAFNENFPSVDYSGYHRTSPVDLLTGLCVGSYIGGQRYCADGYGGVGSMLRGLSVQDLNNQRQEMLR